MTEGFRPTWVEVDLEAIRHNARVLKPDGAELMAVVKANGYGHGDVEVARAAIEAGATWAGVALVEEGLRLRGCGDRGADPGPVGAPAGVGGRRARPSAHAHPVFRRRPRSPRCGRSRVGAGAREDRHRDAPGRRVAAAGRGGVRSPRRRMPVSRSRVCSRISRGPRTTTSRRRSSSRDSWRPRRPSGRQGRALVSCMRRTRLPRSCIRRRTSTSSGPASRSTGSNRRRVSAQTSGCGRRSRGGAASVP